MKRWFILILGLIMTATLTGCTRKSEIEIQEEFLDYLSMVPFNDLTVLYDKKGNMMDVDLGAGDLGVWNIDNFLSYWIGDNHFIQHVILWFNRNTMQARGFYYYEINDVKEKYPIYYDATGIHLENEADVEKVGEALTKIVFLFQYLDLDKEYLNSLEMKLVIDNPEAPLSSIDYYLNSDDKHLKKTLELYPQFKERITKPILMLESDGTPWSLRSQVEATIYMGDRNSISSSLFFTNKQKYAEAVGK